MKLIFALLMAFGISLQAAGYDSTLLKAHAKLLPKIMLLDKNIEKKLIGGKVRIVVISGSKDMEAATEFKNQLLDVYEGKLMQFPLQIEIVESGDIDSIKQATALYALSLRGEQIAKVARLAKKEGIISFAYNHDNLSDGMLVSVRVETKTVIYFNRSAWEPDAIALRPEFFKVARAYE